MDEFDTQLKGACDHWDIRKLILARREKTNVFLWEKMRKQKFNFFSWEKRENENFRFSYEKKRENENFRFFLIRNNCFYPWFIPGKFYHSIDIFGIILKPGKRAETLRDNWIGLNELDLKN